MANMDSLPLRGLHLPDPVGWWPPALGWWLVLALTLLALTGLTLLIRRWRQITPVKAALQELRRLEADNSMPAREKLQRLSRLMKRVALSLHSREAVAGLTGDPWLLWLDEAGGGTGFSQGAGRSLAEAPFRPTASDEDVARLMQYCRDWLQALDARGQAGILAPKSIQSATSP